MYVCLLAILAFGPADGERLTLAVADFQDVTTADQQNRNARTDALQVTLQESIAQALQVEYQLVERQKLNLVLAEQAIVKNKMTDPDQAAKLGRIVGAQYILTGTITEMVTSTRDVELGTYRSKFSRFRLTVVFKIVDTTTTEVVVTGMQSVETDSRELKREGYTDSFATNVLAEKMALAVRDDVERAFASKRRQGK